MTWPCCSELLRMDPAELAVFFPFLFLELPNPNLWPAEGAGPTLNLPENGHGYPPGLKVAEAVASLRTSGIKKWYGRTRVLGSRVQIQLFYYKSTGR